MLGINRDEVSLVPHREEWSELYEEAQAEVRQILGANVIDIQHIGSTAIKGIPAKPILDVAVIVRSLQDIDIEGMERMGYEHRGEAGIPGRVFFMKLRDGRITTHHIHCYEPNHRNLLANIAFRDFLNAHPDSAKQYGELKLHLAEMYPRDRDAYTEAKTEFISMVLRQAGFS